MNKALLTLPPLLKSYTQLSENPVKNKLLHRLLRCCIKRGAWTFIPIKELIEEWVGENDFSFVGHLVELVREGLIQASIQHKVAYMIPTTKFQLLCLSYIQDQSTALTQ